MKFGSVVGVKQYDTQSDPLVKSFEDTQGISVDELIAWITTGLPPWPKEYPKRRERKYVKEDLKQLVEEYIDFEKTDDSFALGKRVQGIRGVVKNEALISFILWKLKGKKLSELVELSEALKSIANFIGNDIPISGPFKNEEEYEEAFKRVDSIIECRVQQKLLEQSKQSAESAGNSGDGTGDRTVKSRASAFFKRFFG